jgi:preprotein translocase subunit Sec61beta
MDNNYHPPMIRSHRRHPRIDPVIVAMIGLFLAAITLLIAALIIAI